MKQFVQHTLEYFLKNLLEKYLRESKGIELDKFLPEFSMESHKKFPSNPRRSSNRYSLNEFLKESQQYISKESLGEYPKDSVEKYLKESIEKHLKESLDKFLKESVD